MAHFGERAQPVRVVQITALIVDRLTYEWIEHDGEVCQIAFENAHQMTRFVCRLAE